MLSKRKLTFQLTPLLDLLLIVIFAQYMEVQQTSAKAEQEIARRASEQTAAALKLQRLAEERLEAIENQRQTLQEQLQQNLADVTDEMQRLLEQRKDLAALVGKLFQFPPGTLEAILKQENRSVEEQQRIRELANELAEEHRTQAIKHLITHQAMRKRVDVWTLFLPENGKVQLKAGDQLKEFSFRETWTEEQKQLAGLTTDQKTERIRQSEKQAAETFSHRLFDAYQTLPQPKSVVVILVSWEKADRHYRKPALNGLDDAIRLIQTSSNRTQFVPAVLGLERNAS